jgi:hypothetical protein
VPDGSKDRTSMIRPILKNSMKKICEKPVDCSSIVVCNFLNLLNLENRLAMDALRRIILVDDIDSIIVLRMVLEKVFMQ